MNTLYSLCGNTIGTFEGTSSGSALEDLRDDRVLVWHDEFITPNIDENKWTNLFGYYNDKRYYMPTDVSKNAYCKDGTLVIQNLKDFPKSDADWSGAFISTKNKFEFKYGLVEAKIKFPSNAETNNIYHSTFWTLGHTYERVCDLNTTGIENLGVPPSTCGEIDIAEANNGGVSCTLHWATPSTNEHKAEHIIDYGMIAEDWHIYGIEWTETTIRFYLDRVLKATWSVDNATTEGFNAFRQPHFLMLNSNPTTALAPAPTTKTVTTECKWVRVYAPEGVAGIIKETEINLNKSEVNLTVGNNELLHCSFVPANVSDMTLVWESYNENVAIVHGGKVTAIGHGTTYIRCRSKNGFASLCKVTVTI